MSQFEKETLSALLDNEADDLELRRLLKSIDSNPELAETWERYCLEQSLMHDPATPGFRSSCACSAANPE